MTDDEWAALGPMLPRERGRPGRPAHDNRPVLDGILWILRTGAPWRDLPGAFGKWNSGFVRFSRWTKAGLWDAVLHVLTTLDLADHAHHSVDSIRIIWTPHRGPLGSRAGRLHFGTKVASGLACEHNDVDDDADQREKKS